ncbi:MAG: hypothetical protein ACI9SP_003889 [Arenicella sp.]
MNKRKTSLKLSLSPDANHYPIGPIGGLEDDDALEVVSALDKTSIDLTDISGGTYFPGAKSASDISDLGRILPTLLSVLVRDPQSHGW